MAPLRQTLTHRSIETLYHVFLGRLGALFTGGGRSGHVVNAHLNAGEHRVTVHAATHGATCNQSSKTALGQQRASADIVVIDAASPVASLVTSTSRCPLCGNIYRHVTRDKNSRINIF